MEVSLRRRGVPVLVLGFFICYGCRTNSPELPGDPDRGALGSGGDIAVAVPEVGGDEEKGGGALPTVADLMVHVDRKDSHGIEDDTRQLLLAGERGFDVLHRFFHQCDIDREKIISLTHDHVFVYPFLRLVAQHPDEVAALSRHLMLATRDNTKSFVRREIYNFVPVFLHYHEGKYSELRTKLQQDIVYQLQKGGDWLYKMSIAMSSLGFAPPAEAYLPCLLDPERATLHDSALRALAQQGGEGLEVILRFLRQIEVKRAGSVAVAVRHVIELEKLRPDSPHVQALLEHENEYVRQHAILNYYRFKRSAREMPRVLEFLNSDVRDYFKRTLVQSLPPENGAIILALDERLSEIEDKVVRNSVARYARAIRKRLEKPADQGG